MGGFLCDKMFHGEHYYIFVKSKESAYFSLHIGIYTSTIKEKSIFTGGTTMAKKVSEMTRQEALDKMWELARIIGKHGYDRDVMNAIYNIASEWNDSIGYYAHNEIQLADIDSDYWADSIDPEDEGKTFEGLMIDDEYFRWEI